MVDLVVTTALGDKWHSRTGLYVTTGPSIRWHSIAGLCVRLHRDLGFIYLCTNHIQSRHYNNKIVSTYHCINQLSLPSTTRWPEFYCIRI